MGTASSGFRTGMPCAGRGMIKGTLQERQEDPELQSQECASPLSPGKATVTDSPELPRAHNKDLFLTHIAY